MTVNTIKEAWNVADRLFPTDYIKDDFASERAGYPIYKSTADGVNAWISDLGTSLEVNLDNGDTVRINIDETEKDALVAEEGQVIDDSFGIRENINWSAIYTALIKESAKCRFFASDIIIDIESMEKDIKVALNSGYDSHVTRLFGFRENGVDHDAFILSRGFDSKEYRTIWRIDIDINRIRDRISAKLRKLR